MQRVKFNKLVDIWRAQNMHNTIDSQEPQARKLDGFSTAIERKEAGRYVRLPNEN